MSYEAKYPDWEEKVKAAAACSKSATEAAALLDIKYDTYKRYAIKYNCFITNQSGKGLSKAPNGSTVPLTEILEGRHPQYQSHKLKLRLIKDGYFKHKCDRCGNTEWQNHPIPLELEHIDGNSSNHTLSNLSLLCPNCHALTSTYRGKNKLQEGVETRRQPSRPDEGIVQTTNK
jgi:hypothetical protein